MLSMRSGRQVASTAADASLGPSLFKVLIKSVRVNHVSLYVENGVSVSTDSSSRQQSINCLTEFSLSDGIDDWVTQRVDEEDGARD